jgi:hypothetical protein
MTRSLRLYIVLPYDLAYQLYLFSWLLLLAGACLYLPSSLLRPETRPRFGRSPDLLTLDGRGFMNYCCDAFRQLACLDGCPVGFVAATERRPMRFGQRLVLSFFEVLVHVRA